jgi:hypothetical protein
LIEKIYDLINLIHVDSKIHTSVSLISDSVTNNITDVVILIMGIKNSQIEDQIRKEIMTFIDTI